MGFMKPQVSQFAAYLVETECGTEVVPEDVCGEIIDVEDEGEHGILCPYLEGSTIRAVERVEGWWHRFSAPGYMDRTDWDGPFDTQAAAQASIDAIAADEDEVEIETTLGETTCADLPESAER